MKNVVFRTLPLTLLLALFGTAQATSVNWAALATSATAICLGTSCTALSTTQESGGGMSGSANTLIDDSRGKAEANVQLTGSSFLPIMGASAITDPGSNAASATATGVQTFTNSTGANWDILLDINLTATVSGDADAEARVGVFLTDTLNGFSRDFGTQAFELNFGDLIGSDTPADPDDDAKSFLSISGGISSARDTLSFTIPTDATFIVWAGLQTSAFFGGSANAFNTLKLDFIDDNGNILDFSNSATFMPDLNPIPLPAGVWLFLTGIGLVAGLSRRRRTAVAS